MSNSHELPAVSDELIAARAAEIIAELPEPLTYDMPYPDKKGHERVAEPCDRCGGPGRIEMFRHVLGGQCFKCQGAGSDRTVLVSYARQRERTRVKRHNDSRDRIIRDAAATARRELETIAHEQALEQALSRAAALNQERAERAARGLREKYPVGAKITDLIVTFEHSYTFERETWGGVELVTAIVFVTGRGHELVWYSAGASARNLKEEYGNSDDPVLMSIKARAKRYQERDDGTARVVVTHVTATPYTPAA